MQLTKISVDARKKETVRHGSIRREDLFQAIEGHVLQRAELSGKFQSRRE